MLLAGLYQVVLQYGEHFGYILNFNNIFWTCRKPYRLIETCLKFIHNYKAFYCAHRDERPKHIFLTWFMHQTMLNKFKPGYTIPTNTWNNLQEHCCTQYAWQQAPTHLLSQNRKMRAQCDILKPCCIDRAWFWGCNLEVRDSLLV